MKAIVTGSFDPITLGHMEIIKYACQKYDQVYVVALVNEAKEYMFTMEQKKTLIEKAVSGFENVIADAYVGWTADYMHSHGITQIVRGYRNEQDMAYENELAQKMNELDPSFNTEIIRCKDEYADISSTLVREKLESCESLEHLVPSGIIDLMKNFIVRISSEEKI